MVLTIKELIYVPERGGDVLCDGPKIDFNSGRHKTKESAAKAFYAALCDTAREYGQNPDSEVRLWTPEQSQARGFGNCWTVVWEAGPFEWGIAMSAEVHNSPYWYTEPYYSFDLTFTN